MKKLSLLSLLFAASAALSYSEEIKSDTYKKIAVETEVEKADLLEKRPDTFYGIPYPMKRWGVSILSVNQKEHGKITNVDINLKSVPISIPGSDTGMDVGLAVVNPDSIKVTADVKLIKADYFLLPFLSVYGIYGKLDATINMKAGHPEISIPRVDTGKPIIDGIANGIIDSAEKDANEKLSDLKLAGKFKTEGDIVGGGALLAGEYKNIFAMAQYTYSEIFMKDGLAKKKAMMANGRLGYSFRNLDSRFITSFTPYAGVAYSLMDTQVKAGIDDFKAVIDLEMDEFTPAAGVFINFPYDITLLVETTWGTRDSIAIDLGYRF